MSIIPTVSIYGAGIAGLTIAHELVNKGFNVNIYEKDNNIGGMAKSKRDKNNIPSEHSWRGYGPFYYNTFDILKKIPIKKKCQQQIESYNNVSNSNSYTLEEIAKHNTVNDLWTHYQGNVYNLTDWVPKHPGGRVIIKAGGKDLEKVWKEMGLEWHIKNTRVIKELEKYKIGILNNTNKKETFENTPTVYDNLSKETISFYLLNDRTFKNINISLKDYPYLSYIYLKGFLAKSRKDEYFKKLYLPLIKNYVSQDTYDYLIYFGSGPGFGFDINKMSYGHYTSVVERQLQTNKSWQVMAKPTSEAWFDNWVEYLKTMGVNFYLNTTLKKINFQKNRITSCEVENQNTHKIEIIEGDEHCICINPYSAIDVFKNSNIKDLYEQHESLKTVNKQIGFIIAFKEKINFPQNNMAFVIIDSPYNITFYPQDYHWCKDVDLGKNVQSLWSGTCIMPFQQGGLSLSIEKFKEEILNQFFNSKHLQQLIKKHNNDPVFSYSNILSIQLYDEWYYDETTQSIEAVNKKWVNDTVNEEFRPNPTTNFLNLYIGGSHCKTSVNIWSMEGAVESGKTVSNLILNKYKKEPTYIYKHHSHPIVETLGKIDDILYTLHLPNIVDVILVIFIIWIILRK